MVEGENQLSKLSTDLHCTPGCVCPYTNTQGCKTSVIKQPEFYRGTHLRAGEENQLYKVVL